MANVSNAKLPSCTVAISGAFYMLTSYFSSSIVLPWHFLMLFVCEIKQEWMLESVVAEIYLIAGLEPLYRTQQGKSSTQHETNLAHF